MPLPKYSGMDIYIDKLKQSQNYWASLQAYAEHQNLYCFIPRIVPLLSSGYAEFTPVHSFIRENVRSDVCFKLIQFYSKSTSDFFVHGILYSNFHKLVPLQGL